MGKTLFEQTGGTYKQVGDYLLPDVELPEEKPIGVWGQQHLQYLKQYRKAMYDSLLLAGKLNDYLTDIDKQANEMFQRLVKQLAEKEAITEQLKATDQMEWVRRMNAVRATATEIVNKEIIHA